MELNEYISYIIFKCNSIHPELITKYSELLIYDINKRSGNKNSSISDLNELFWYVTKIPFYCLTKITNASFYNSNSNSNNVSINNIVLFMKTLYTSSNIIERTKALFSIFDYDNDSVIHLEDIRFFIRNYYLVKYAHNCKNNQLDLLDIIITNSFNDNSNNSSNSRSGFTFEMFKNMLLNINGDIFYLYFILSSKDNLFHIKYLDLFIQYNSNTQIKEVGGEIDNSISIVKPSALLIQFIEKEIFTFNNFEKPNDNNDFSELEDFETSVSSCISNMSESVLKPTACLTGISFKKYLSNLEITKNNLSLKEDVKSHHVNNSSHYLISFKTKLRDVSIEHEDKEENENNIIENVFDIDNNYAECTLFKYGKDGKMIKTKVIIQDNMLFLFSKRQINDTYKIDGVYILNGYFPSYDGCVSKSESSYHKLILRSNINHQFRVLHLFSNNKNKITNLIDIINHNLNRINVRTVYTFQNDINRGSFGTLYLCKHNLTNQTVAIKQIAKTIPNHAAIWEQNIFYILKAQPCQFIIKSYEIFESFSNIYLVYEYYPFGTLRPFILKQNKTQINDKINALFIYQQILAIEHLNKFGIVHRDIKPDNLMLNIENNQYIIKLIDFGLSKIISPNEKTNEPFGTLVYSAPEVISANPYCYSPDIWSIGMVIYFLIFKVDPFMDLDLNKDIIQELISKGNIDIIFIRKKIFDGFLSSIMKKCLLVKKRVNICEIKKLFMDYICYMN